jgi:hypothetical protein
MVSADESSFNSMSVHHIFLINLSLRPCLHKEKKVLYDLTARLAPIISFHLIEMK